MGNMAWYLVDRAEAKRYRYHFLTESGTTGIGGIVVKPGSLTTSGPGGYPLAASNSPTYAIVQAPGPVLEFVRLMGVVKVSDAKPVAYGEARISLSQRDIRDRARWIAGIAIQRVMWYYGWDMERMERTLAQYGIPLGKKRFPVSPNILPEGDSHVESCLNALPKSGFGWSWGEQLEQFQSAANVTRAALCYCGPSSEHDAILENLLEQ